MGSRYCAGNSSSKFRWKIPTELAEISRAFLVASLSSRKVGRGQQELRGCIKDGGWDKKRPSSGLGRTCSRGPSVTLQPQPGTASWWGWPGLKGGPGPMTVDSLTIQAHKDSSPGPLFQPDAAASFLLLARSLVPLLPAPKPTRKNASDQTQAPKDRGSPLSGG